MATRHAASTSFWQRLRRGPWGKPVAERIEEALDTLTRRLRLDNAVVALLVFGSYARGEAGRTSDLDLLILLRSSLADAEHAEAETRVARAVADTEVAARLPVHLTPLIVEAGQRDELGSSLVHKLWVDGVILYAEAAALAELQPQGLCPWDVVRFSLPHVPPRDRVRLARRLHGRPGRPGIIHRPGLDLARGAALVPADQTRAVQDALDEAGATYDMIPVWRET
jgi:predicted nucleotidyltransferase